jgi:hypothetical protein
MARTYVSTCLCMQVKHCKHVRTFLIRYRSGGMPCVFTSRGALLELRAVDEGAVPASAPVTSRLFVLPVAARRWVLTNNRSMLQLSTKKFSLKSNTKRGKYALFSRLVPFFVC